MNRLEICLLLAAIPIGLVAAGYWLVTGLRAASAAERLAAAMLAGLGASIWTVSVVNLVLPLGGIWGWTCLMPMVAPLLRVDLRRRLVADLGTVIGNRRGAIMLMGTTVFLGALLWPLFSRPEVVFYDGTSGHDAFFWIVGAEHLKRQSYLQQAVTNPVYPLFYSIESIAGLKPVWGRMGAEGLLALTSNLVGASPLKIYVAATATLFFPWVAAVFLVVRTFLLRRTTLACALALVTLQPVFLFFHANANLPNLLGAIAAAGVVVALQRAIDEAEGRRPWLVLAAFSMHALACCYPEMIPGVALTGGLLAVRAGWSGRLRVTAVAGGAALAGLMLNPVTTLRAGHGLISSLVTAGRSAPAGSIFDLVSDAALAPAMVTLSSSVGRLIGTPGGWLCGGLLAIAAVFAVARARDRFGALAMLAGGVALLAYTLVQSYPYGWQKTVQFCGAFVAALLPFGIVGHLGSWREVVRGGRRWTWPLGAAVAGFFAFATVAHVIELHKWAGRKFLTREWFAAREFSRKELHNVPVLVDAQSFSRPFFYSMWAAYFLDESRLYFTGSPVNGGYLRPSVEKYPPEWNERPGAVLAGPGAELPGTTPLWEGQGLALLRREPGAHRIPRK